MGRIGEAIARKLTVFDADISYHTRTKKDLPYQYYDDLVTMAHEVEVLICITPGGPATRHLVNGEVIKALGSEGMLINAPSCVGLSRFSSDEGHDPCSWAVTFFDIL